MRIFSSERLHMFSRQVLSELGVREDHGDVVAEALVRANLEGVDSHGVSRLSVYCKRLKDGRIKASPSIRADQSGASVLMVDGDNGLGHVVSYEGLHRGMEMAKETGLAGVAIKNSNHFGTASFYCQKAIEEGLAAIAFTNSPPGIAPWGGRAAFFGTNPIGFGFPTGNESPIVIDLSTSVVARGKIILANKEHEEIPEGWAVNELGENTTDPAEALKGAVLPLGGAKGSALALAVEVLTGVLSGAAFGPNVNSMYNNSNEQPSNIGHFFILMDIEKFMTLETFEETINELLLEMKATPKAPGVEDIRYPGERRRKEYLKRSLEGIPLSEDVIEELTSLGKEFGVSFPDELKCIQ
ncbi:MULTISPECIES: Ldh family oxidoreductase [Pontibacillus]|uniref:Ldh family oxidoreductase n=1 Tax=Pontibacillus chungwhensis TaxID=265426 RepID=A0ABY8UYN6_9BACI|nr:MULTISPECIES: Ldh family oxidoreductase [Pontibacillus]MCD5325246.1 Ldh family oxidoreductase [Pontibacillus sp. HN14]WIF97494.1 Ldh family oxidoreductase [Pontibacillus chungwhensis]